MLDIPQNASEKSNKSRELIDLVNETVIWRTYIAARPYFKWIPPQLFQMQMIKRNETS